MCILVVIRTYICMYLSILPLNSYDAVSNIKKITGYLNNYILILWYNSYLGCMQIFIHLFLTYNSTGQMRILIVLSTYIGKYC